VIDTASSTVIGSPIPVGTEPFALGVFIRPAAGCRYQPPCLPTCPPGEHLTSNHGVLACVLYPVPRCPAGTHPVLRNERLMCVCDSLKCN
jgi:hypothetical protein